MYLPQWFYRADSSQWLGYLLPIIPLINHGSLQRAVVVVVRISHKQINLVLPMPKAYFRILMSYLCFLVTKRCSIWVVGRHGRTSRVLYYIDRNERKAKSLR